MTLSLLIPAAHLEKLLALAMWCHGVLSLLAMLHIVRIRAGAIDFGDLRSGVYKAVKSHCAEPNHAAITFDDGIHPDHTPRLLEILKERNVTATFFILGQSISRFSDLSRTTRNPNYKKNRGILRRMVADGHEVGSHSFDHTVFTWLDKHEVSKQLDRTADLVEALSAENIKVFAQKGYTGVHWNHDTEDWKYHEWDSQRIISSVKYDLPSTKNGMGPIILQHDTYQGTVNSQEEVIRSLKKKGYKLVSMSECLRIPVYTHSK